MKNIFIHSSPFKNIIICTVFLLLFAGCEGRGLRSRETGALIGGTIGAGLGAIVGNQVGHSGGGIAIGGALGALSGAVMGNEIDRTDDAIQETNSRLDAQDRELQENARIIRELKAKGFDAEETDRGVVVNLPDILFEFNRAELTSEAQRKVHQIARAVEGASGRHISVEGHTDSVGSDQYNNNLSEDRADNVARALARDGVARSRLSIHGYGESKPIASNNSSSGRAKNRRVEVVIEK